MIALIDYQAGNLTSVKKALAAIGAQVFVPGVPEDISPAETIIVPGVGHFGATRVLTADWIDAIRRHVDSGRRLLGICLGMQWLYESSDEAPDLKGLGVLSGHVVRLEAANVKVPHVGWNSLTIARQDSIVSGVPAGAQVYFTHSYVAPITADTVAVTEHGQRFAAIVRRDHIAGVQFHPEKSGDVGLQVLRNFVRCVPDAL
jgi:glutamine amidotransferase